MMKEKDQIEESLSSLKKYFSAWVIAVEKNVDIGLLKKSHDVGEYNQDFGNSFLDCYSPRKLTLEEFTCLKEGLSCLETYLL